MLASGVRPGRGRDRRAGDAYPPGEYDLAGFAVGVVERSRIVTGALVRPGDRVLGLASSGLHSNGYSLARKVVFDRLRLGLGDPMPGTGRSVADELLEPTRIYVRPVLALLAAVAVKAMAHVTGGGLTGNLPRVLPDGCRARIDRGAWPVPPVFALIQDAGGVPESEMRRTFNMGVGYAIVVAPAAAGDATALLRRGGRARIRDRRGGRGGAGGRVCLNASCSGSESSPPAAGRTSRRSSAPPRPGRCGPASWS